MPTINIRGQGGSGAGGSSGGNGPKNVRGAAWDNYQAAIRDSQAAASKKESQVDAVYAAQRVAAEKQVMAMWSVRNRQEQASRKSEAQLLKETQRVEDALARNRAKSVVDSRRAQAVKDRAERGYEKRTHAEALYENRNVDARARKQERGYRQARAEADYENRNVDARTRKQQKAYDNAYKLARFEDRARDHQYAPVGTGIASVGARGSAAIRDHDPVRALAARAQLSYMGWKAKRGVAAGGPQAATYGRMLGSVNQAKGGMAGETAAAGLLGVPGLGEAYMAYKAAKFLYNAPSAVAGGAQDLVNQASPYTSLLRGAADIGGAGGFNAGAGSGALSTLQKGSLAAHVTSPSDGWRRFYGVTGQSELDTINAYGSAPRSKNEATAIAMNAAGASLAPGLQGMSPEKLASMAGGYHSLAGPNGGSDNDFYRNLQHVFVTGTTVGMNKSRMSEIISRVQGITAASGGSMNSTTSGNYVASMIAAGGSGARSGSAILGFQDALTSSISGAGFGGNMQSNMTAAYYVSKHGMPNTKEKMEAFIGQKYENLEGPQKEEFDNALTEAKSGSIATMAHTSAPLFNSDDGRKRWAEMIKERIAGSGIRKSLQPSAQAGVMGTSIDNVTVANRAGYTTGAKPYRARDGGMGWADVPPDVQQGIMAAAAANGIPPAVLAGLINKETGGTFDGQSLNKKSGAYGYGQVLPSTFADMQKRGKLKGYTFQDVTDPMKGPEISAEILREKMGKGSVEDGLRNYVGYTVGNDGHTPDIARDSVYSDDVLKRSNLYGNNTAGLRANDYNADQLGVDAAKGKTPAANAVGEGAGGLAVDFNHGVANFNGGVEKFVLAIAQMITGGGSGGAVTPMGGRPMPGHWPTVATP